MIEFIEPLNISLKLLDEQYDSILCLNSELRIIYMNRAARKLVTSNSPLKIRPLQILTARNVMDGNRLRLAVNRATQDDAAKPSFLTLERAPQLPLHVAIDPFWGLDRDRLAAITIRDPEAHLTRQVRRAAIWFGFTPSEAILAEALVRGSSPAEHASERKVSVPTVRSHLRALLAKAGATRQSELVANILSIPAH